MIQIKSESPLKVRVIDIADAVYAVSYKINRGEISFYYWIDKFECPFNFYLKSKNDGHHYTSFTAYSIYLNARMPSAYSATDEETFQTIKDLNLNGKRIDLDMINNWKSNKQNDNIGQHRISCVIVSRHSLNNSFGIFSGDIEVFGRHSTIKDNDILCSAMFPIPNTSAGRVCWGSRYLDTMAYSPVHCNSHSDISYVSGKINTFLNTPFNNDYCSLKNLYISMIEKEKYIHYKKHDSTLFCVGYDSILMVSQKYDPIAYLRLYSSGIVDPIITETDKLILLPLNRGTFTHDNIKHNGYYTPPDRFGKTWFVSESGYLIGQVDS